MKRESKAKSDVCSLTQLLDQGQQLIRAGNVKGAARVYQIACLRHPFDPTPWLGAGLCQKQLGDNRAAELALGIASALGADHPGVLVHRAECRARRGRLDLARDDLEEAKKGATRVGDIKTRDKAGRALAWLEGTEVAS